MATRIGLEPTTPSVTGWCSNQLSYRAMIAQVRAAFTAGTCLIIPEDGRLVYKRKKQKAAKKMKKADFLSLLTAFAASSFHEGEPLCRGTKAPSQRGCHRAAMTGEYVCAKTKPPERLLRRFVAGVVSLELTARGFGDRCSTN